MGQAVETLLVMMMMCWICVDILDIQHVGAA